MIGRIWVAGLLGAGLAMGQAPALPTAATATEANSPVAPTKPLAFDVISIRQNMAPPMGPPIFGPTADGYSMMAMPLILPIMTAYVPSTGAAAFTPQEITGLPDWAMRESYDIQAKVADEDLPGWQNPATQKPMLQAMMQALLVDRCKIVVHRESKEAPVYSLVVGKSGPKFKPTNPDEAHEGMKLPFGGTISAGKDGMVLYAASIQSVATLLSSMGRFGAARPIQDKTGLTGLYDIAIPRRDQAAVPSGPPGGSAASDPGGDYLSFIVDALGLKLEWNKAQVETLVVDHIERPSQN